MINIINDKIYYYGLLSPIGNIFVASTTRGICLVNLSACNLPAQAGAQAGLMNDSERNFEKEIEKRFHIIPVKDRSIFIGVEKAFIRFFDGTLKGFDFTLDLRQGTPFQKKIWLKVKDIPYGQIRSYKWVATEIGNPKAYRAVGNANGKNPIPIIIPCHRVIREDGGLGGYKPGIEMKKKLLRLEGITI